MINLCFAYGQSIEKNTPPENLLIPYKAGVVPDRIILSLGSNTESERLINWRTDTTAKEQYIEISEQDGSVDFYKKKLNFKAESKLFVNLQNDSSYYHQIKLHDLEKGKKYSYRVGYEGFWSPWFDFEVESQNGDFQFIYLGDAQNDLLPLWSRVIHNAYKQASNSTMILHVGDLINHSQNDYEWAEWFHAASPIIQKIPQVIVPGNHEYIKDDDGNKLGLSPFWDAHFNFPKNGPSELRNQAYYFDYGNCKFIFLNSNEKLEIQASWLEKILENNEKNWTIIMFHHPVVSGASGRINEGVLKNWKPILDRYQVDLVLQGHDHVYGRGNEVISGLDQWNEYTGTVYVVSVAGRKMYPLGNHPWMQKKAENLQTYQIVTVQKESILFDTYKTNGDLFDSFEIKKLTNGDKQLIERLPQQ